VVKHVTGAGRRYNPADYGLAPIWEASTAKALGGANAYRQIALEGVTTLALGGLNITFK